MTGARWRAASLRESREKLDNRERGFYQIRAFLITDGDSRELYDGIIHAPADTGLILLELNLKNYASGVIRDAGMAQIETIFKAYEELGADLIVRFAYDLEGKAFLTEPSEIGIILGHMDQLAGVMERFWRNIYIVQGVFAGNWGEMHGSAYLKDGDYLRLLERLFCAAPKPAFLAVRTPAYWRIAAKRTKPLEEKEAWDLSNMISRLSLFNDGILGNAQDYGTYGTVKRREAVSVGEKWRREDELGFQERLNLYVPNGGEVIGNSPLNDLYPAVLALRKMHISYLNADYNRRVLEKWKHTVYRGTDGVYNGLSGYEYVERHLGYRFVIRSVKGKASGIVRRRLRILLEVENVGFSPRYTPCRVEIIFRRQGREAEEIRCVTDSDVRSWKPSCTAKICAEADGLEKGSYDVWFKMTGCKRGEAVLLANEGVRNGDGEYFLGTFF